MATSLRADARRNRTRILRAAEEAFSAEGGSVSLDEIARRAGVGPGTVHRHFPTKEALLEAIVSDGIARVISEARAAASAQDPGDRFFSFCLRAVERISVHRALCDALEAGEAVRLRPQPDTHDAFRSELGRLLADAQAAGAVRPDLDVEEVVALLVGAVSARRQAGHAGRSAARVAGLTLDAMRA